MARRYRRAERRIDGDKVVDVLDRIANHQLSQHVDR
jgi:hypothetical protein